MASFPIIPLAQLHSRYVNHVADEGPANLLDAMAKLRLNPYVDSWGSSSIISPQVPQLVRVVEDTDVCFREALCRRASRRVLKKPTRTKATAQSFRTNAIGESFSEAKELNVPERLEQLDVLEQQNSAEKKKNDVKQKATDLKAAAEIFILQSLKDPGYTAPTKKSITVNELKLFCANNDVVVAAQPGKPKSRADWIRAVQLSVGTEKPEGFLNHDKSARKVLVIPPGYEAHTPVNVDVVTGVDTEQEQASIMALEAMESDMRVPAAGNTEFQWEEFQGGLNRV